MLTQIGKLLGEKEKAFCKKRNRVLKKSMPPRKLERKEGGKVERSKKSMEAKLN
jgi:hypothetical protein